MRAWLLTSTTDGSWLPSDARGSVTSVRDRRPGDEHGGVRIEHDLPAEPWEDAIPESAASARDWPTPTRMARACRIADSESSVEYLVDNERVQSLPAQRDRAA